jgi:hypothetical protein
MLKTCPIVKLSGLNTELLYSEWTLVQPMIRLNRRSFYLSDFNDIAIYCQIPYSILESCEVRKEFWMKKILLVLGLILLGTLFSNASAQVFYLYPGAPVVPDSQPALGTCLGIGDDLYRINGYGRFNISKHMDMGLELVFDRASKKWRAGAGADLKYAIIPNSEDYHMPFDLAVNGGFGLTSGNDITFWQFPVGAVISKSFDINEGSTVTPYGGLYVLIMYTSVDLGTGGKRSNTETDVEMRLGAAVGISEKMNIHATLHFGSGTIFYLGLNLGV